MKKCICICLCAVLLFLNGCGKTPPPTETPAKQAQEQPVYNRVPHTLQKKETVFATLSATGTVQNIRVTDELRTDIPEVRVTDKSPLTNVRNIKGQETPVLQNGTVVWNMQQTQLFYSGTTQKPLPVAAHLRYYLNDREVQPEALKGERGRIRIEVTAENRLQRNTDAGTLYTPFLLAGGALLAEDAQHITVQNGSTVGDGTHEIAFGILLPGMSESLGLSGEADFLPHSFSINFTTETYTPPEIYFVLLPLSTAQLGDAIRSVFGTKQLPKTDYTELFTSLKDFSADGTVQAFLRDASNGTALFAAVGDAMDALSAEQPLLEVLQTYLTAENAELLKQTLDALSGTSLSEYAALLKEPAFMALLADMGVVSAAFTRLIPVLSAFVAALNTPQVRASIEAWPQSMAALQQLTDAVEQNRSFLDTVTRLSENGTMTKMAQLFTSVQSVLQSGTLETITALSERADALEDRLTAVLDAGKAYGIFTDAPEDAETSVYFVLKVTS